jgi:hypothetical protein
MCAAIMFSVAIGLWVYYVFVNISALDEVLNTPAITVIRIQLAAPEAMLGAYVLEGI